MPTQLGSLPLQVVSFAGNNLGAAPSWNWLMGKEVSQTLHKLDLSENNLMYFPYALVKLRRLAELNLSRNQIPKIPFAIRALRNLRNLDMSSNCLKSVPQALTVMRFEYLDLSGGSFLEEASTFPPDDLKVQSFQKPASMLELAGRVVKKKLPYSCATIPAILVEWLNEGQSCECGNICYDRPVFEAVKFAQFSRVNSLVLNSQKIVLSDCVYCSLKCFMSAKILMT